MSKRNIIILIILVVALGLLLLFARGSEDTWLCQNGEWVKHGQPSAPVPTESCGDNAVACTADAKLCADGSSVSRIPPDCNFAFCPKEDLIQVTSPQANELITSPLIITGQARGFWFFEADFPVKLFDGNGHLLATAIARTQNNWMTEDWVPFRAELNFSQPITMAGELVLEKDNPSDLPENADELRVPVKFAGEAETMTVQIYFNNNQLDPEISCSKVFPVEREIVKTSAVARAALTELLQGVTEGEQARGYSTNINSGVNVNSLIITDGVVQVDFDEQLEKQVGGSCRVSAIRAQITETLKQFSTVDQVIIAINGRTEDILQP